jgi:hypothetical protein
MTVVTPVGLGDRHSRRGHHRGRVAAGWFVLVVSIVVVDVAVRELTRSPPVALAATV